MKILVQEPPNIEQVDAAFQTRGRRGILYAYGDTIYNPSAAHVPNWLVAHELVHGIRQGANPEAWWRKYIEDVEYRYAEELAAHKVELGIRLQQTRDRNLRAKLVMETAARLSNPLYKSGRALAQARKDLAA